MRARNVVTGPNDPATSPMNRLVPNHRGRASWLASQPDVVLVAAAQRDEVDALNTLLERHHDRVRNVCHRITANQADAADATQEALIAIAKGIRRFDGTASFSTWIYRIATNASLDELRRRTRRPVPTDDSALTAASVTQSDFGSVEATVDLSHVLGRLPVEFRAPLVLRDVCGLDYAEIAEILAIPGGTVRSRIARARSALAPLLGVVAQTSRSTPSPDDREPASDLAASKERL
jgi:RNA polymerase sigma-70 factor, ECF subfamily